MQSYNVNSSVLPTSVPTIERHGSYHSLLCNAVLVSPSYAGKGQFSKIHTGAARLCHSSLCKAEQILRKAECVTMQWNALLAEHLPATDEHLRPKSSAPSHGCFLAALQTPLRP